MREQKVIESKEIQASEQRRIKAKYMRMDHMTELEKTGQAELQL